jgi:hypothetical protein
MRLSHRFAALLAVLLLAAPLSAQKGKAKPKKGDNPYAESGEAAAPKAADTPAPEEAAPTEPGATPAEATGSAPDQPKEDAKKPGVNDPGAPDTKNAGMRAYQAALAKRRLAATAPLSRQRLRDELGPIETKLADGRRDEAIGDLVYLIETPRFEPFAASDEGRAAQFLLGDALGRSGAYQPARGYLVRLLKGDPNDTWYRRAVRSMVDFGLESDQPEAFIEDLKVVPSSGPEEMRGDIAYLRGRAAEKLHRPTAARAEYAKVTPRSRFWAQATYLSGLIEVERGDLKKGENLFCKVADPKLTPKKAPLFGGSDFFRVRDLARLALGRVAHEKYRFDDSRYYYYLVPSDSEHLPEALYESATSRYEAKDYDGARDLMDELRSLDVNHPYEDEAWILDAYIDLATCHFPKADAKLAEFLKRYDPVRDAARRIAKDDAAVKKLVEAVRTGADPASAGLGVDASVARTLGALLRVDSGYGRTARRVAQLDNELSGLRGALNELDEAQRKLATPKEVRPQTKGSLAEGPVDKVARIESQVAEVKRLIREAKGSAKGKSGDLASLEKQLEALEIRARAARTSLPTAKTAKGPAQSTDKELSKVIDDDRKRAVELYASAEKLRAQVEGRQVGLAKDALVRLDRRLSRLLRRARLGRIETVLGEKRALEVEVEALSQGLLPQTIVDSLDAARYLRDDEEYWPFDGEDWEDEYVGGEGLR